jgi:hypothetical protein
MCALRASPTPCKNIPFNCHTQTQQRIICTRLSSWRQFANLVTEIHFTATSGWVARIKIPACTSATWQDNNIIQKSNLAARSGSASTCESHSVLPTTFNLQKKPKSITLNNWSIVWSLAVWLISQTWSGWIHSCFMNKWLTCITLSGAKTPSTSIGSFAAFWCLYLSRVATACDKIYLCIVVTDKRKWMQQSLHKYKCFD